MSDEEESNDRKNIEQPTVIRSKESDSVDWGGLGIDRKIDGSDTGERFAIVHHPMAPRVLGALLGDEIVEAGPGSWVFKPRDQWHTFWNAGDSPCHLIEVISPAGFEDAFREWDEVGEDMERMQEIDKKYALDVEYDSVPELCERFGVTYSMD